MKQTEAVFLAGRIHELANKFIMQRLEENGAADLSPSHGDILTCLYRYGRLTMTEIAAQIHRTKPTVTVLVTKLQSLGLVEKSQAGDDSRIFFVSLTERGRAFEPIFQQISQDLAERVLNGVEDGEIAALENILKKLLVNLDVD